MKSSMKMNHEYVEKESHAVDYGWGSLQSTAYENVQIQAQMCRLLEWKILLIKDIKIPCLLIPGISN